MFVDFCGNNTLIAIKRKSSIFRLLVCMSSKGGLLGLGSTLLFAFPVFSWEKLLCTLHSKTVRLPWNQSDRPWSLAPHSTDADILMNPMWFPCTHHVCSSSPISKFRSWKTVFPVQSSFCPVRFVSAAFSFCCLNVPPYLLQGHRWVHETFKVLKATSASLKSVVKENTVPDPAFLKLKTAGPTHLTCWFWVFKMSASLDKWQ